MAGVIPTMTYFEQALSAPELHFQRLRQVEPLLVNGEVIVRRTHHAIESEIIWDERRYILFLPFNREIIKHIENLNDIAQDRSIGPLLHHRILYSELTLVDSLGRKQAFDILLQEKPEGTMFEEALLKFKSEDLRQSILKMKDRLDILGFLHGNLRPYNIIICKSGVARPLRYWYAKWGSTADNNIAPLLEAVDTARNISDDCKKPLILSDDSAEYNIPRFYEGIKCICRGGRYGYIDYEGVQVTPYIYSSASNFQEGRAVVGKNNKFGAIDNQGKKVIPVIYHTLEFDVTTGLFSATMGPYSYLIDYDGRTIRRTKIEEDKQASTEPVAALPRSKRR